MRKKINFDYLIPIIVLLIFTLFSLTDFNKISEYGFYDIMLNIKPSIPEDESILFLDIDDTAIAKVGNFPWSRDIMADGLITMKEFGAAYALFDIIYTEESPKGINKKLLSEDIPFVFSKEFGDIKQNTKDLYGALLSGSLSLSDAGDYIEQLAELTDISKNSLLEKVNEIARDNDEYYGQTIHLFENAFFTINMLPEKDDSVSEERREYAIKYFSIKNTDGPTDFPHQGIDIRPAINKILDNAKGAGFPEVVIDKGGVRRRINLVMKYNDYFFPQLAFSPLLDLLGKPEVIINDDKIILKNAEIPGKQKMDITIPLAEDKSMLINWPNKTYFECFRHLTYWYLVLHKRQVEDLIDNLKIINTKYNALSYYEEESNLLDAYNYAENIKEEILAGGDPASIKDYREIRDYFFSEVNKFLQKKTEEQIISDIGIILNMDDVTADVKEYYSTVKEQIPQDFSILRNKLNDLVKTRNILEESIEGSFCIIGWVGLSTTDKGATPFDKEYYNVGTHGSIINTILNQRYLDDLPWWYSLILAFILVAALFLFIRRLEPLPTIFVGVGFIIFILTGWLVLFLTSGIYLNLITPLLSVFFTFIALTGVKFLITAKEKSYIKNAFSHYLSADVINELLSDPDKLALGGEKKHLTALFTDVKGFSSISEILDPTDLVKLLNAYLTEMSNIVLNLRGTIDKYEGDAIISFFGAPVTFDNHAHLACLAAVRMKKMEKIINDHFLHENLSPKPLFTRIGINTGEMVVGNMGTANKMDYTIMGNSVNLASRLEGVNKQYGTWMLLSKSTYDEGGKNFVTRQLDNVRVVGIKEPVRLYELIDEKGKIDDKTTQGLEIFQQGLEFFEKKEWKQAKKFFQKVLNFLPDDGPSNTFIKRCSTYIKKPPLDSWDGVYNLSKK